MKEVVLVVLFVYFCLSFVIVRTMKPSLKKKVRKLPIYFVSFSSSFEQCQDQEANTSMWTYVCVDPCGIW